MRVVYFTHSLASCWNHGNAHFLRGLLGELGRRGHDVTAYEPADGWSRRNLLADHGEAPFAKFKTRFPRLDARLYGDRPDAAEMVDGAHLVIVHEWTEPALASALGTLRKRGAPFALLFHDTHHRAISDPEAMRRFDLSGYDGVLAFGDSLANVYRRAGWGSRVFVFHEAADTHVFKPPATEDWPRTGVAWIGNWGDDERGEELVEFLLRPARGAGLPLDVYGVRYPAAALSSLREHGAVYHGWIANADVPAIFARALMTVHAPRRFYATALPGIPTIRVFEALACGVPLLCAPWRDTEGLFTAGEDYLLAENEDEMRDHMRAVANDSALRRSLTDNGLKRIRENHTCAHRADQLLRIADRLKPELAEAV